MKKRLVGGGLFFAVLLLLGIAVSGCGGEAVQPSQEDRLVNQLFKIEGAEFSGYQEGSDDSYSEGRPSFTWYRPEESRREIGPYVSGVIPELPGQYTHVVTYFNAEYAAGVYRHFTEERFLGESSDLVIFRVDGVEGTTIHASLVLSIKQGDRAWGEGGQGYLDQIEKLSVHLSKGYLWRSPSRADAFAKGLEAVKTDVAAGQYSRSVTEARLGEAMEQLFQDAFSGSGVEVKSVSPSVHCSPISFDGKCWIRDRIGDSELQLQDVVNAGEATAALRSLPGAIKDLIGEVEVLTLEDSEFGVVWGRTSYLGFQDKFGNWFIFVS